MTDIRADVAGIAEDRRAMGSPKRKPSPPQVYKIARMLLEIADVPFPETSRDASALIDKLNEQLRAIGAAEDGAPF
jgi:hypothetical protein